MQILPLGIDILLKYCTTCGIQKELAEFNKKKTSADGHRTQCRSCQSIATKEYSKQNKEAGSLRLRAWRKKNPEAVRLQKKRFHDKYPNARFEYRTKTKEHAREVAREWAKLNKEKVLAYGKKARQTTRSKENKARLQNKRRAVKLLATVLWDRELTDLVEREAYHLCSLRKEITKFRWEVDHVIPLQGKTVSGLHVWNNLAVIPATLNSAKSNKY